MTNGQKVIKYLALAFAFFIILSIIKGIAMGIGSVNYFYNDNSKTITKDMQKTDINNENINNLNIDLNYSSLEIRTGNEFAVETNNSKVTIKDYNNTLDVKENNSNWYNHNYQVIVYIPENIIFDKVNISNGAGEVNISSISCSDFEYSIGAGKTSINNLVANDKAKIDGGAGKINIDNGIIGTLNLDMGVGKTDINANITADSKISAGVGSLNLNLLNTMSNYKIRVDKGLGSININGHEVDDESTTGSGLTDINVDGGVGSINISTK